MKQWMNYVMIIGLTAGTASAAWWPFGDNKSEEKEVQETPAVEQPAPERQRPQRTPEQMEKMRARREAGGDRQRSQRTPEQMEKMKAQREELMKLGEAARNETDPAAKEELIGQLRAKLLTIADQMQAEGQKRLEQAEAQLARLKERQAEAEAHKNDRIEEQIKKILSGEYPRRKHSDGSSKKDRKGAPEAPPVE